MKGAEYLGMACLMAGILVTAICGEMEFVKLAEAGNRFELVNPIWLVGAATVGPMLVLLGGILFTKADDGRF